jgi:Mg/Co/Ni transporter MgtE
VSPRAAWRLETIGFTRVYDYSAGKADWGSFGNPLEGQRHSGTRVGAHLRADVPTCTLEESLRDVRARVRGVAWETCFVVNEHGILLGRLGRAALDRDDDATVEEAMTSGPRTVRPSIDLSAALERMRKLSLSDLPVTHSNGLLVGVIRGDDAERALQAIS